MPLAVCAAAMTLLLGYTPAVSVPTRHRVRSAPVVLQVSQHTARTPPNLLH